MFLGLLCLLPVISLQAASAAAPETPTRLDASPSLSPSPAPVTLKVDPEAGSPDPISLSPSGQLVIPRLAAAPKLNDFLTAPIDPVAATMLHIHRFVENYPVDGLEPLEQTDAYLGYTHEYFYAAFVCEENDPKLVRAHMLQRDSLADDDNVQIMLDTFHDQRRAFLFASNPFGIQADALYSEQSGFDYSFDTVWDTWARRTPTGYVVLFRIPFASLYFAKADPGEMRTWGIILIRNVSHSNESDFWPRNSHNIAGRLTQSMEVDGFRDIEHGQNHQFQPYTLARNQRTLNSINPVYPFISSRRLQGSAGLDSKFILHNSLVLDATIHPDFSQVGVNNPAAPNQRFPVYFPEIRPFFIENSSYFLTPFNLYYTDNIVAPQFGARLTGKLGPWAVGLLGVDDQGPGQAIPPGQQGYNSRAYFYAARLNRDVGALSNVGLIYVDREYLDSFNRIGGFDYRARVKSRWTFTGQAVTSETNNLSSGPLGQTSCETGALACSGQAYFQEARYTDLHRNGWIAYTDASAGYVTDTGFFQRPDMRQLNSFMNYTFRPIHGPVLSDSFNFYTERIWDHHGVPLDFYFNPSYNISFKGRTFVSVHYSFGQDRLRPVDYSALPSNLELHGRTLDINFNTSPVTWFFLGGGFSTGKVINYSPPSNTAPVLMNGYSPRIEIKIKPGRFFDLQNSYTYTHYSNPASGKPVYDNHQVVIRWNYQMTKAVSLNLIGQYLSTLPASQYTSNANSKNMFADVLLTYMPHPGTAVYIGYIGNFDNIDPALCTRLSDGTCNANDPILAPTYSSLMNDNKTIYVKLSYLLRF